ncbi:MAG TPA: inositol monophosphatase family protein [Hyphomicrobiaceae bacterium]|jgi:myo-inositol-1(or 4)-monophosphatase|nr:inositol monophosphatase family protein [Hyphomicrobiaceae bacterium]
MPASALLTIMIAAARKAGRGLARDFGELEQLQVSVKGPANFASTADHRSEDTLFKELSRARPGYGFLMEERGIVEGPDRTHRWVVDPLDGTTNFLHGVPLFCIAIALEREGEIVAGLVYNPILDELYTAERGQGAFLNSRRLRVASRRALADCLIAAGIPHRGRESMHPGFLRECGALMRHVAGIRRTGSAAIDLAWVAAGRFDGYLDHNLGPWDVAAGTLLVREAGGHVTDGKGGKSMLESGSIVAGNPSVHRAMLELLAEAKEGTPA